MKDKINAFAIIGLIFGILSALGLYGFFAIPPILAIIFSSIALFRIRIKGHKGKNIAIIGLILGILFTTQFGIKTFLKNNDYFQYKSENTISQGTQENSTIITKSNIIGTWKYFESNETSLTDERIELKENNTFLYSTLVHIYGNEEQPFHAELTGTYTFLNNIITLNISDYTEKSNDEWARFFIGQTRKFEYKNGKLISMQGNKDIFEKQ